MNDKPLAEKIAPAERERFFTAPLIIIFTTVFIDLVGFGMVIPILPFYAETPPFSATPFEIGALLSIYSWMQFFFSPILGRLSDRYGRRPILFISLIGSVVGLSGDRVRRNAFAGLPRAHHQRYNRRKYLDRSGIRCRRHDKGKSIKRNGHVRSGVRIGVYSRPRYRRYSEQIRSARYPSFSRQDCRS